MASAKKKTKEEEKKKGKETKLTKPEKKNNTKTKPKTKTNTNKKTSPNKQKSTNKISNGTVSEPEAEVEVVQTSSTDSKQEEIEEEKKTQDGTNQRSNSKSKQPKKSGKKQELDDDEEEDKDDAKNSIFPMSRMRRIMKSQGFDSMITGEAVFLVNKATEKFLQQFCEDAYAASVKDRKKSVSYKHLASVVSKQRRYDFLSDFVPEQIKAEDALAERKISEMGEG